MEKQEQEDQGFSWREFLRYDDWTNQIYTGQQIGWQLTAVVFDLDNTLIDSKAKLNADVVQAFKRLGKTVTPEQAYDVNWYELAEQYGIQREEFDQAFDQRKTWEQSLADGEVPMFPETIPTLEALKQKDMALALLSKSIPSYTQTKLDYFDLGKYFRDTETIHPKEPSKDPAAIELVRRLGPQHFETFYFIGDKPEDVTCEQAVQNEFSDRNIETRGIYLNRQGQQLNGYPSVTSLDQIVDLIK